MTLPGWTLRQKIGQLIVVRASGYLFDQQIRYPQWEPPNARLYDWLSTLNLGGVILLGGGGADLYHRTRQLQAWSPTPLLIAADIEEGVGQRFSGAAWLPPPMALGEIARRDLALACDYAEAFGAFTAQEALALGINWILAPIADVNNNPQNPVINIRAFGEDPETVGALVQAFIRGAQPYPALTCAKHFPGHGDTGTDSHLHLPVIPHAPEHLAEIELPPFQQAIAQGVDSVMSAHIQVPAWDTGAPATLSRAVLTGQLRQALGFEGLIVTDALIMGGITQCGEPGEVAIRALDAGADILLMPPDPVTVIDALVGAVESGRLTEGRIDASLERIQRAKAKLDFNSAPDFPFDPTPVLDLGAEILLNSQRQGGNLPLQTGAETWENMLVVDDLLNCDVLNRVCPALKLPQSLGYSHRVFDQTTLDLLNVGAEPCLLQVFVRGNPFRGQAGLSPEARAIYQTLLTSGRVRGLILYGSPYVLEWFLSHLAPATPWVFSYGQMPQAQALACQTLLGEAASQGQRKDVFV
ncbi:MAG: glycoside hydrolase family 3 N-terminal domain-containing protein [Cyanobacteriota bacterium]|jgi:beta-glucosidase